MKRPASVLALLAALFLVPAGLSASLWSLADRPAAWHLADWSSARLLPPADEEAEAAVYVLAARTGGLKGVVSMHSWIVVKPEGGAYERWDKVGWGTPVRRNRYVHDGLWFSNAPHIVFEARGARAEALIPKITEAVAAYPHAAAGDYRIFPCPNSNSFVAHVLREAGIAARLPALAVGRDFVAGEGFVSAGGGVLRLSLFGYAGLALSLDHGLEMNLLGLVAGLDPRHLAVSIPAVGEFGLLR